ncbi:hypothetical protein ND861_12765 [Leptospira sp. 2 VSF19]|uniref:Dolichyl-phosphate-mannose-protein mannosyltransferase n=1 Tax=Leptospira soteropolitanensis TaxID=2950025 RepID=A0AAW5VNA4_9LEPT|nr:hypothetical protein [Leptospira soteropolitanensis]MCW7493513.1 hypothetical protein [Leptospira soteropolitanensis]MCW7500955.1 hypothetical protein [Leptospira soteropolitanensis]MCW7523365.1 hypothetical protein [Leptospira soteropolitanensis]MCW7527226.1 hypothetical protein [Leptospira soteropolitanensis]MCW7531083.1 hypothetical protein [Leptospira soteropolitanensis]
MIHSKKAIGFFFSFAILVFVFFASTAKGIEPFADFALLEWQSKLAAKGLFHLPYNHQIQDPSYSFFPLPDLFFQLTKGFAYSTFPNLYPILISPILKFFGLSGIITLQSILFFIAIYTFHQIEKNSKTTLLLLFGSTLPIYIFLIHETVFIFTLEIFALYLYHKKLKNFSGIISAIIIWIRPEMSFVMILIPFCFEKQSLPISFYLSMFSGFCMFALGNLYWTGSFLPFRLLKNSDIELRPENIVYLSKIWILQVPIFTISCLFFLKSLISKINLLSIFLLLFITIVMILLAPNSGGHNTPRYLFGLVPLYVLLIGNKKENGAPYISFGWIFLIALIAFYTVWNLNFQIKELKKISKFQSNTLNEIRKIKDSVLIFSNPDFAFVSLPLLEEKKDLLLLRKNFNQKEMADLLFKENIRTFTFLELPPSPIVLPDNLPISNCLKECTFRRRETHILEGALLPISKTLYQRN